jgi:hypothetical protein
MFQAFRNVQPDEGLHQRTLSAVQDYLVRTRGLPLSDKNLAGIEYVLRAFRRFGPAMDFNSTSGQSAFVGSIPPSYMQVMTAGDDRGSAQSYLATEDKFAFVKEFQSKNLLIPVVGDFAGPHTIRAIGEFLIDIGENVTVFYVSNVEQYLHQRNTWGRFCANVMSLPLDHGSALVRAVPDERLGLRLNLANPLVDLSLSPVSCR